MFQELADEALKEKLEWGIAARDTGLTCWAAHTATINLDVVLDEQGTVVSARVGPRRADGRPARSCAMRADATEKCLAAIAATIAASKGG
ncbi:MAG: hypothetical protein ACHREM_08815 [Polyangiales bacterium]